RRCLISAELMAEDYSFTIAQCDVPADRRSALESYRAKRREWISWLDDDPDHAIWTTISQMVWIDVSFRALSELALADAGSCLTNSLIAEKLINGHVATQVLAIRRLVEGNRGVISLRRLLIEIRSNFHLFTRENYVCYDGLPYDYEPVMQKEISEKAGKGAFWGSSTGPESWSSAQMAHEQFDRLSGIAAAERGREDRLPPALLDAIEGWLADSDAESLAKWSHAYLAHAGCAVSREQIAELKVTNDKITNAIRTIARVTEALSAYILYAGGRANSLMPTAQFDQFEGLDRPATTNDEPGRRLWDGLTNDRDEWVNTVREDLIKALIGQ
ncbi:MAG: hypothetical protein JWQ87_2952, partial [Candidatus Sulfotelmatobacter sp.]|nr:hypothetical protein [Candidatus Sulfotelmatobacter sp.]